MNDADTPILKFPLLRSFAVVVGIGTAAGLVGFLLLGQFDRHDLVPVMAGVGLAACLAAIAALIPIGLMAHRYDTGMVHGAMIGFMVRLFGTFVGAAIVAAVSSFSIDALAIWAIGWYVLFLAVEVGLMVRYLGRIMPMQPAQGGAL